MLKVKVGQKFKSKISGKAIRVIASYGQDAAAVTDLKKNGHRDLKTVRVIYVDSIRRKYQPV
jgi:hypothetical protein